MKRLIPEKTFPVEAHTYIQYLLLTKNGLLRAIRIMKISFNTLSQKDDNN